MATYTVIGVAADSLGWCTQQSFELDERGAAWHHVDRWKCPASVYRVAENRSTLDVDWRHGRVIGEVASLEREHGSLWAVAEVDGDRLGAELVAEDLWWSSSTRQTRSGHETEDAELRALALTPEPASVALPKVRLFVGDLEYAKRSAPRGIALRIDRAIESRRRRLYGQERLHIHDLDPPPAPEDRHGYDTGRVYRTGPDPHSSTRAPGRAVEWSAPYAGILSVR